MNDGPTVVKLGGSHAFSDHLPRWIEVLEAAAGKVVVVPGGGPFADVVRAAQPRMGFGDAAAHVMAMLAMAQYGLALTALAKKLDLVTGLAAMRRTLARARVPVWSPLPMALRDKNLAQSWDITSDSLALWLANCLGAPRLLLVKQVWPKSGDSRQMAEQGLLDRAFPALALKSDAACWVCGPESCGDLAGFLAGQPGPMVRVHG